MALDDVRVFRVPWRKVGAWLLALLGFVVAGFVVTNSYATISQQGLEDRWAEIVASGGGEVAAGEPVAKIVIPALDVERVVLEGDDRGVLRRAPGHVPGSAIPGSEGNAVIKGHRLLWSGPFQKLDELNLGAEIHIQTATGTAVYLVAGTFRQDGSRIDMYEQTSLPYLTLVTSDPPWSAEGTLVIRAAMVERDGVAV
jgi:LPXTG-site transpeptidase (sortase) family protein